MNVDHYRGAQAPTRMDIDTVPLGPPNTNMPPWPQSSPTIAPGATAAQQHSAALQVVIAVETQPGGAILDIVLGDHQPRMRVRRNALLPPKAPGVPPPGVFLCQFQGRLYWLQQSDIHVACRGCNHFTCNGKCAVGQHAPRAPLLHG